MFIQSPASCESTGIGSAGWHSRGFRRSFLPSYHLLGVLDVLRRQLGQVAQSREVVGGHRQRQELVNLIQSLHHHLTHRADELAPAKALDRKSTRLNSSHL